MNEVNVERYNHDENWIKMEIILLFKLLQVFLMVETDHTMSF